MIAVAGKLASSLVIVGVTLVPVVSFSAEPVRGAGAGTTAVACEQCHADPMSRKYPHSAVTNGACVDCHLVAAGPTRCQAGVTGWKLARRDPDLCVECHDKSGDTPLHRIINLRGCTACHDPHGTDQPQNLKQPVPELCLQCHRRVDSGRVVHRVVSQGSCLGCHEPHAGVIAPLLREERKDLCAECHEAAELRAPLHRQTKGACLDCHAPHSSDLPKLERPPRDAADIGALAGPSYDAAPCAQCHGGLTARKYRHSFFGSGTCADCHVAVDTPGKCKQPVKAGWRLARPEPQLCAGCHDKSGDTPMHKVIDLRGCTACHDPHSASEEWLLQAPAGELCRRCHQRKDEREFTHTAVKKGLCVRCHEPHSGVTTPLLREERKDLCVECHEEDKLLPDPERHGPVTQKRCLECHDPHGSNQPKALLAAGRDLCLKCHARDARAPGGAAAATKQLDLPAGSTHDPVRTRDCQTCHVQTHSGKVKLLLRQRPLELCTRCHDKSGNTPMHRTVESGGCVACHLPHSSKNPRLLKSWPEAALCYSCHDRKDAQPSVHTAVKEGKCLGCHSAHAGEAAPLLRGPRAELCSKCHEARSLVRGSEAHAPVTEGDCLACHAPHGSAHGYNLRAAGGTPLCMTCHDAAKPSPAVPPGKQLDLARANVHAPLNKEGCPACHEVGHSGDVRMLLRKPPPNLCYGCHQRQDARAYTHGAVRLGDCPACHSPHASNNPKLLLEAQESKSCFRCHQDDLTGRAFVHKPAAEGKCLTCHDPHGASAAYNLKVGNPRESCARCHPLSAPVTVKHVPLERHGCVACHDPHGTANQFQLLKPVNELCQGCHRTQADGLHATTFVAQGHVVSGPADPRREGRAFTCASCHNPHGANNPKLFYFGKGSMEMCEGCHGDRSGEHQELQDVTRIKRARSAGQPDRGTPPPRRYTGPPAGPVVLTRTEGEPGVPSLTQRDPVPFDMPAAGTPAARAPPQRSPRP